MKKNLLLRIGMACLLTMSSLVLFQSGPSHQITEEQPVDEEVMSPKKRGAGDFIIWESISRYIMASYH